MLVEKLLLPYILFSFLAITVCQPQGDIEAIGNRSAGDWIPACLKSTDMKVTSMAGAEFEFTSKITFPGELICFSGSKRNIK